MSSLNRPITTDWDDQQRKHGNLPPLPNYVTESELIEKDVDTLVDSALQINQSSAVSSDFDIDAWRQKRLSELKAIHKTQRFNQVYLISKENFIQEVTGASSQEDKENNLKGTWVVVLLLRENCSLCDILSAAWDEMAQVYGHVKFGKGYAKEVIPDYPNSRIPTCVIYFSGTCQNRLIGSRYWHKLKSSGVSADTKPSKIVENVLFRECPDLKKLMRSTSGIAEECGASDDDTSDNPNRDSDDEGDDQIQAILKNMKESGKGYTSTTLDQLVQKAT